MQSDNGREFVNQVINDLLRVWQSNIQLLSGRPRHPQSQGLVERAHQTLPKKCLVRSAKKSERKEECFEESANTNILHMLKRIKWQHGGL